MKLTAAVAALAAGATMASASPLRVIVVSNAIQKPDSDPFNIAHMRFGHPASHANNPNANVAQLFGPPSAVPVAQHGKGPCMGALFRQKALEAQNAFRKALGLPLIEHDHHQGHPGFHHGGVIQVVPHKGSNNGGATFVNVKGSDATGWWGTTKGGERVHIETQGEPVPAFRVGIPPPLHTRPRPHHHHMMHHSHGGPSFMGRLEDALMALGPWEGRAVAFVIGAGIGVLIRMLWVFGVLMFRGCSNDGKEYEAVPEDDDEEDDVRRTPLTAPPTYVYPIDEKVGFEYVEAPKAQPEN